MIAGIVVAVVIEDDAAHLNAITDALNCMVYPAMSVAAAEAVLRGVGDVVDVVVSDVRGTTTHTTAAHVAALRSMVDRFVGRRCPIVIVSAVDPWEVETARAASHDVFAVPKPWTRSALRGAVNAAMEDS
jgi:DNA-binding NtrC family response regulator